MATFCFYPNRSLGSSGSFPIAKTALFCKFVTLLSLARNWVEDAFGNFPEKEGNKLEACGPLPETRTAAIPSDGFAPIISRKQKGEKL